MSALRRSALAALVLVSAATLLRDAARAQAPPAKPLRPTASRAVDEAQLAAGRAAFLDIARVLQSPRCMNCHPSGDRPLRGDNARVHAMNVSRTSAESGLPCATCHRHKNSAIPGGPPGVSGWKLPPRETPMVFQGLSPSALCRQLVDPAKNGNKTLEKLEHHMEHDELVHWGWHPGPGRTTPPLTHPELVARVKTWVAAGGPCP